MRLLFTEIARLGWRSARECYKHGRSAQYGSKVHHTDLLDEEDSHFSVALFKLIFRLICLVHKSLFPILSQTLDLGEQRKKGNFLSWLRVTLCASGFSLSLSLSLCVCVLLILLEGNFFLPRAYQHGNSGNPSKMMESFACRNRTRRND